MLSIPYIPYENVVRVLLQCRNWERRCFQTVVIGVYMEVVMVMELESKPCHLKALNCQEYNIPSLQQTHLDF
jgi:hypothetical protein